MTTITITEDDAKEVLHLLECLNRTTAQDHNISGGQAGRIVTSLNIMRRVLPAHMVRDVQSLIRDPDPDAPAGSTD